MEVMHRSSGRYLSRIPRVKETFRESTDPVPYYFEGRYQLAGRGNCIEVDCNIRERHIPIDAVRLRINLGYIYGFILAGETREGIKMGNDRLEM